MITIIQNHHINPRGAAAIKPVCSSKTLCVRLSNLHGLPHSHVALHSSGVRDAAPVTPAVVQSVSQELRAAATAAASSWRASALDLPSDFDTSLLAPAVLEAYPAAARVVDMALVQQAVCKALEVGNRVTTMLVPTSL